MATVKSCIVVLFFLALAHSAWGSDYSLARIDNLIENGGYIVTKNDHIVAQHNPGKLFIPASTLKIATSLAALSILGPSYRFETEFYLTETDDLFIKGSGDPFLTSEEVRLILFELKEKGVQRINNIFLDDTAFQLDTRTNGSRQSLNPYDALNSALATNFNTIHIAVDQDGSIRSAEPQTPTLPIMRKLGAHLSPGTHRINITRDTKNILSHTGELFRAIQHKLDIPGNGAIASKNITENLFPFHVHVSSKNILDIIPSLLLYSNNYIANQLFLACGVKEYGYPATWEKGRLAIETYLKSLGLKDSEFYVVEGSGLSSENKITPEAMITLLDLFKPYSHMMARSHGNLIKSGTLTGVYSYAGYIVEEKQKHSFVIILNQDRNTRSSLLQLLEKKLRSN